MKIFSTLGLGGVLWLCLLAFGSKSQVSYPADGLKPTVSHVKVQETVVEIMKNYAYKKAELDDSLSNRMFKSLMKDVDYGKIYFTEDEYRNFKQNQYELDNALKKGDLSFVYQLHNAYLKTSRARYQEVINTIEKAKFDFEKDESYELDGEKTVWAKDKKELDERWRKLVKYQALELKLAGKPDSAVVATLKSRYKTNDKFASKFKSEQVFSAFMNAFAEAVDPHCTYFSPANAENFNIDMSQSLEGIGAVLTFENDFVKINDIVPGGPAFKSKLLAKNDRITAVAQGDGGVFVDIVGWTTDEAVKLIRGPKGTIVRLQVLKADMPAGTPAKEIRIVREKVKLEDSRCSGEIQELVQNKKNYKIGVITVPSFYRDFKGASANENDFVSTTRDVKKIIADFKTKGINALVIDVRNNGGGAMTEAVELTGLFIDKGPVVQQREINGKVLVLKDTEGGLAYDGPLVVMTNRFSASASEIFAGAIQDYKRGLIIGEPTYGKGTVQNVINLNQFLPNLQEQLGNFKLTIAKFYRINGSSTQRLGVKPDIEFPSAVDAKEVNEGASEAALPWDQIATTSFTLLENVNDKMLKNLKNKHLPRFKSNTELANYVTEINDFKIRKDKTNISLKESVRKKERVELEKRSKALFGESFDTVNEPVAKKDKPKMKDIQLNETNRIVADWIEMK